MSTSLQPHQQRVVAEKAELDEKISKLDVFIESPQFDTLCDVHERLRLQRLQRQRIAMVKYSRILSERIDAFTPTKEPA